MALVNSRFLNVKYHQASVGKFKKVAAVSTIAFVLIIVMVLTFGSAPTKKIAIKRLPASPEPKEPGAEKQRPFLRAGHESRYAYRSSTQVQHMRTGELLWNAAGQ